MNPYLTRLTEKFRQGLDSVAFEALLSGDAVAWEVLETLRLSVGLTKAAFARLMGYTSSGSYQAHKQKPFQGNDIYLQTLRVSIQDILENGLKANPESKAFQAVVVPESFRDSVPVSRLAASTPEWRHCANPHCHKLMLFTHRRKIYCSQVCKDYVARHEKDFQGRLTKRQKPNHRDRTRLYRCPECGHEFIARGNLARHSVPATYGQADHDSEEQMDG